MNNLLSIKNGYSSKNANLKNGKSLRDTAGTIKNWMAEIQRQKLVESAAQQKRFTINQLLESLSNHGLARLLPYLERVAFDGEENIYKPEEAVDFVYFPETAVMSEFQILEDGRTVEIAMTGREGVVGLSAIFSQQPSMNWTQISLAGTALKIKTGILKEEFARGDALQTLFFDYVNSYISQISQRVICNSYHTVEKRLCSWLLMLQERKRSNDFVMTQEQIARFLGVHRPSVTQIAQTLRRKKIINYMRGKISILDRDELRNSACECYEINNRSCSGSYLF